jgi:hypothetical protein
MRIFEKKKTILFFPVLGFSFVCSTRGIVIAVSNVQRVYFVENVHRPNSPMQQASSSSGNMKYYKKK